MDQEELGVPASQPVLEFIRRVAGVDRDHACADASERDPSGKALRDVRQHDPNMRSLPNPHLRKRIGGAGHEMAEVPPTQCRPILIDENPGGIVTILGDRCVQKSPYILRQRL
jgi:hypothetical protein